MVSFEDDIQSVINELCKRYEIDMAVKELFDNTFKSFKRSTYEEVEY